jgi:protein-tyrosine phosphatase
VAFDNLCVVGPQFPGITDHDVRRIVFFVHDLVSWVEGILAPCHQGLSRSPVVARWIAEADGLPFGEATGARCNRHVLRDATMSGR